MLESGEDNVYTKQFYINFPHAKHGPALNFFKSVEQAYSPKALGFECYTTANYWQNQGPNDSEEVWIGGECLIMKQEMWEQLRVRMEMQ